MADSAYQEARDELANVQDPAARAMVLALLAITEELVLVGDPLRGIDAVVRKAVRLAGWMKR